VTLSDARVAPQATRWASRVSRSLKALLAHQPALARLPAQRQATLRVSLTGIGGGG
jgi:hypothetical protein